MERNIINSNIGVTNEIKEKEMKTTMINTLDKLSTMLVNHCGPKAGFAILASEAPGSIEPIFTTDGINIIRALEFASPLEEFVKQLIIYIGTKVDTHASDGTTSAMLVTISVLKSLIEFLPNVAYNDLVSAYNNFKKEVFSLIEIQKEKSGTDRQSIRTIAFNQALTSSHGDIELSKLVADMFTILPQATWNYVTFELEKFETDIKYKLVIDNDQYTLQSSVFNVDMLKSTFGTEIIEEDTDLLIFTEVIITNQLAHGIMMDAISNALDTKSKLSIICGSNICSQTRTMLENALQNYSDHNISLFLHNVENPQINDLLNLQLIRKISPTDYKKQYKIIKHASVKFKNGLVSLNKLYEIKDAESAIHPLVTSMEFPLFNMTLDRLTELIQQIKTDRQNSSSGNSIRYFQKMYNKLYLSKRAYIKIGGSQHDSSSSVDLVTDTVGATRCSLSDGATLGGMNTLLDIVLGMQLHGDYNKCQTTIINAFATAIDELSNTIGEDVSFGQEGFTPLQPAAVDIQLIQRFGELALRFVCSKVILVPNSVWLESKKKPQEESCM